MTHILDKLAGGDRRSIGRVSEVVAEVLAEPGLFGQLFAGMLDDDPLIRMRAADAVEKITAWHREYLQPYKEPLIDQVARIDQQEVRWHVAQMVPRLDLSPVEREVISSILLGYLDDPSQIVKTWALQALADLAGADDGLRRQLRPRVEQLVQTGSPAVKSRGRKILVQLNQPGAG